jgi:hypothetical protein
MNMEKISRFHPFLLLLLDDYGGRNRRRIVAKTCTSEADKQHLFATQSTQGEREEERDVKICCFLFFSRVLD